MTSTNANVRAYSTLKVKVSSIYFRMLGKRLLERTLVLGHRLCEAGWPVPFLAAFILPVFPPVPIRCWVDSRWITNISNIKYLKHQYFSLHLCESSIVLFVVNCLWEKVLSPDQTLSTFHSCRERLATLSSEVERVLPCRMRFYQSQNCGALSSVVESVWPPPLD